jgi:hypothetical protein
VYAYVCSQPTQLTDPLGTNPTLREFKDCILEESTKSAPIIGCDNNLCGQSLHELYGRLCAFAGEGVAIRRFLTDGDVAVSERELPHEEIHEFQMTPIAIRSWKRWFLLVGVAVVLFSTTVGIIIIGAMGGQASYPVLLIRAGGLFLVCLCIAWFLGLRLSEARVRVTRNSIGVSHDGRKWREVQFTDSVVLHEIVNEKGDIQEIRVKDTHSKEGLRIRGFEMERIQRSLASIEVRRERQAGRKGLLRNLRWLAIGLAVWLPALALALGLAHAVNVTSALLSLFIVAGISVASIFWRSREKKEALLWGGWTLLFASVVLVVLYWLSHYGVAFP